MLDSLSILTYGRAVRGKRNWNLHTPYAINRIYFIHRGTVLHRASGKLLVPGKLYLFPQNLKFDLCPVEETEVDHTFLDFTSIPPLFLRDVFEYDLSSAGLLSYAAGSLFSLVEGYPMHPALQKPASFDLVSNYLSALLQEIHRVRPITTASDPIVTSALAYIHSHYADELSVSLLAQAVNYDESVFIRRFKRSTGITPYQYVRNLRLGSALKLLQSTSLSVSEIAIRVGYANVASFSHAFKLVYGIYPSEYHATD